MRLLERDDELDVLARAVAEAAVGTGCIVLVGGEAGIGKTSLVRALRNRLDERIAYIGGACEPLSVPIPLGPVRELVEAAGAGELAQVDSDDRLVLMRAFQDALEAPGTRRRGDRRPPLGRSADARLRASLVPPDRAHARGGDRHLPR